MDSAAMEENLTDCERRICNCEHDLYYAKQDFQATVKEIAPMRLIIERQLGELMNPTSCRGAASLIEKYKKKAAEYEKHLQEKELEKRQAENTFLRGMITRVKQNNPWTIVWWSDGTITRVKKAESEEWDSEKGLLCAIAKHFYQNTNVHNDMLRKWCKG